MKQESTRQRRYNSLIQLELGQVFQQEMQHSLHGAMVTVTEVNVTPDLSLARVYLSFMLAKNKDRILHEIQARKSEVRKHLGNRIGKQVRMVPDLVFYYDETLDQAQRIEEILSKLDIPPAEGDENED